MTVNHTYESVYLHVYCIVLYSILLYREIAGAIKNLLDAVALVTPHVRSQADRQALERQKREFVRHSKHFSTTLKTFFKENSCAAHSALDRTT